MPLKGTEKDFATLMKGLVIKNMLQVGMPVLDEKFIEAFTKGVCEAVVAHITQNAQVGPGGSIT